MSSKRRIPKAASHLALVLLLVTFAGVLAAASGPVDRDITVSAAGGSNGFGTNTNIIRVISGGTGTCVPQVAGAFSRDVSQTTAASASSATLTLTVAGITTNNRYPLTFELFSATQDISENPVTTTALASLVGTSLNSTYVMNTAPGINSTITFPTSSQFVSEVNKALSGGSSGTDKRLTVIVQMTACGLGAGQYIDFAAHEAGAGSTGQFDFQGPNAVTMTNVSAQSASSLPLYGALGLLALVTVGGVVISRRRTAAR